SRRPAGEEKCSHCLYLDSESRIEPSASTSPQPPPLDELEVWGKGKMKKGIHPQLQWISYVTQSGRLMNVTMTKIHQVGKVYHFRAKRQMAQSIGQIAKFKRRYGEKEKEKEEEPENK
ncbi:ribosomal protein L31, partial [Striga asiatica]